MDFRVSVLGMKPSETNEGEETYLAIWIVWLSFWGKETGIFGNGDYGSMSLCSAVLGCPAGASVLTQLLPSPCSREKRGIPQLPGSPPTINH